MLHLPILRLFKGPYELVWKDLGEQWLDAQQHALACADLELRALRKEQIGSGLGVGGAEEHAHADDELLTILVVDRERQRRLRRRRNVLVGGGR